MSKISPPQVNKNFADHNEFDKYQQLQQPGIKH